MRGVDLAQLALGEGYMPFGNEPTIAKSKNRPLSKEEEDQLADAGILAMDFDADGDKLPAFVEKFFQHSNKKPSPAEAREVIVWFRANSRGDFS